MSARTANETQGKPDARQHGLATSDAVHLLFYRIGVDPAFLLELRVPNAETQVAMDETDALLQQEEPSFATLDQALTELEESTRQHVPRQARFIRSFVKDWERLSRCGRYSQFHLKSGFPTTTCRCSRNTKTTP